MRRMKQSKRVPRKIAHDEDGESVENSKASKPATDIHNVVRRPNQRKKRSLEPNSGSTSRTVVAPLSDHDGNNSGRDVIESSVMNRSKPQHSSSVISDDGQSMSLANSTKRPSSHQADHLALPENDSLPPSDSTVRDLDIASKFGGSSLESIRASTSGSLRIPGDAEIQEKKERRRRMANEREYISLNDDDDDEQSAYKDQFSNEVDTQASLILPEPELDLEPRHPETRLIPEDEDIAEGFETFVEDSGKVALNTREAAAQERQRRRQLEEQIRDAQHGYNGNAGISSDWRDDEAADEEEVARDAAYEAVQVKAGTYGSTPSRRGKMGSEETLKRRLEVPRNLKPVSDWKEVMSRFYQVLASKREEVHTLKKRLERIEIEQREIEQDETRIQQLLQEAAERYDKLKAEVTIPSLSVEDQVSQNLELQVASASPKSLRFTENPDHRVSNGTSNPKEPLFEKPRMESPLRDR